MKKTELKPTAKIQKAIDKLKKTYGSDLKVTLKQESEECNRRGDGFADYAMVSCGLLQANWTVTSTGEMF